MDIKDAHIGQRVRTVGGVTGRIAKIDKIGYVTIGDANNTPPTDYVACIDNVTPVSDLCEGCQMLAHMRECCAYWKTECDGARRDTVYWRDELIKLQDEALECKPLGEVAKCYKQVEPAQLLMSQEARRVIEYLKATDCPVHIGDIMDGMEHVMSCMAIMDGLIEAREAGIVRLDDGKYSIARD